jgi:hypothetical protein
LRWAAQALAPELLVDEPEAQCALAMRFQDAIDLITALGWDPNARAAKADTYKIALSDDLAKQFARRRLDLSATNTDHLDGLDENEPVPDDLLAEITANRNAAAELDRLIGAYGAAVARKRWLARTAPYARVAVSRCARAPRRVDALRPANRLVEQSDRDHFQFAVYHSP